MHTSISSSYLHGSSGPLFNVQNSKRGICGEYILRNVFVLFEGVKKKQDLSTFWSFLDCYEFEEKKKRLLLNLCIAVMKAFGFLVMFLVIGTTLTCLVFSGKGSTSTLPGHEDGMVMTMKSSKLKDNRCEGETGNINLEDYRPINPVPSSKASVRPRPIQHGTPLMPYIPKPAPPPGRPKHGGFP